MSLSDGQIPTTTGLHPYDRWITPLPNGGHTHKMGVAEHPQFLFSGTGLSANLSRAGGHL